MPTRLPMWLACWPLLASAQVAGLADAPGPAAGAGCHAFVVGPCVTLRSTPAPHSAGDTARVTLSPAAAAVPASAAARKPIAAAADPTVPSEADVDRYISNHGKPPREVARALLEPSDANIAAMMRRLQRDQAIAAFVGQRMTELSQSDPSLQVAGNTTPGDLPSFSGLRLVLVTRPECAACDRAAQALQQLVAAYPTLDARVAVAGARDAQQIVQEMARSGVTLPTAPAPEALLARIGRAPPWLLAADVRQQREGLIAAEGDAAQLRQALLAFRRAAAQPSAVLAPH